MPTCFSLFSGGGLADVGLHAAGYTSLGGLDNDAQAVAVGAGDGLPAARRLVCSIIGRGVPCLLAQRIGEHVRGLL